MVKQRKVGFYMVAALVAWAGLAAAPFQMPITEMQPSLKKLFLADNDPDYYSAATAFAPLNSACVIGYGGVVDVTFGMTTFLVPIPGRINLYDCQNGKETRTLWGHIGEVKRVAIDAKGTTLISSDSNGMVLVRDICNGTLIDGVQLSCAVEAASWDAPRVSVSGSGRLTAMTSRDRLLIRDSQRKSTLLKATLPFHANQVAFSPDNKFVCVAENEVLAWNLTTGKRGPAFGEHLGPILSLAFSPDSRFLYTGSGDGTVCCWAMDTGARRFSVDWEGAVVGVATSDNGEHLLCYTSSSLRVLKSKTGAVVYHYSAMNSRIQSACFSRQGDHILFLTNSEGNTGIAKVSWRHSGLGIPRQ